MSRQIEVLPGAHLVASAGGVVVVVAHRSGGVVSADSVAARAMTALLGIVRQATSNEPRRSGRTVARLATNWLMGLANGDEDEVEFGVITPGDGGIAVFLHGGVTAVLSGVERSEVLRGREAGFTVDRVVTPAPGVGVGLFVDETGGWDERLPARGVFALGEGTAPGAGAVLWFGDGEGLRGVAPRRGDAAQDVAEPWRFEGQDVAGRPRGFAGAFEEPRSSGSASAFEAQYSSESPSAYDAQHAPEPHQPHGAPRPAEPHRAYEARQASGYQQAFESPDSAEPQTPFESRRSSESPGTYAAEPHLGYDAQHAPDPHQPHEGQRAPESQQPYASEPQQGYEPHAAAEPQWGPDLWQRDDSVDQATENYSTSPLARDPEAFDPFGPTGAEPPRYPSVSTHLAGGPANAPRFPDAAIHPADEPLSEDSGSIGGASPTPQHSHGAGTEWPSGGSPAAGGAPQPSGANAGWAEEPSGPMRVTPPQVAMPSHSSVPANAERPDEDSSPAGGQQPRSHGAGSEQSTGESSPVRGTPQGSRSANAGWQSAESPAVSSPQGAISPNLRKGAGAGESEGVAYSGEQPEVAEHDQVPEVPVRNVDLEETIVPDETMVSRILEHIGVPESAGVVVKGFKCARDHLNDPRVSFCAVCGIRMDQLTCVLTDGVRPPLGLLLLDDGTSFVLDNDCVLGREPEHADAVARGARPVRLEDASGGMSRAHAEIRLIDWDVTVVDGGSTNGTHVRQPAHQDWTRAIPGHPVKLTPGAQVQLGGRVVTFDSQHGQL